jgi:hypothetical protein
VPPTLNLLKIVKIIETFAFGFCTLGALLVRGRGMQAAWKME